MRRKASSPSQFLYRRALYKISKIPLRVGILRVSWGAGELDSGFAEKQTFALFDTGKGTDFPEAPENGAVKAPTLDY